MSDHDLKTKGIILRIGLIKAWPDIKRLGHNSRCSKAIQPSCVCNCGFDILYKSMLESGDEILEGPNSKGIGRPLTREEGNNVIR